MLVVAVLVVVLLLVVAVPVEVPAPVALLLVVEPVAVHCCRQVPVGFLHPLRFLCLLLLSEPVVWFDAAAGCSPMLLVLNCSVVGGSAVACET